METIEEVVSLLKARAFKGTDIDSIINVSTDDDIVTIITALNEQERYWHTETGMMIAPRQNMSKYNGPDKVPFTQNVFFPGTLPNEFVSLVLKATESQARLCIHIDSGPFGFYPVFSLRHLITKKKHPAILKFTKGMLSPELYDKIIALLYSKENQYKHRKFKLDKIEAIEKYTY